MDIKNIDKNIDIPPDRVARETWEDLSLIESTIFFFKKYLCIVIDKNILNMKDDASKGMLMFQN